jgi:hypothetical protein
METPPEPLTAPDSDSVTDSADLAATPPDAVTAWTVYVDPERTVHSNPNVIAVVNQLRHVREQYGAWDLIHTWMVLSAQKPQDMDELHEILECMIRRADPGWSYDEDGGYWGHASLPGPALKLRRSPGQDAPKVETTDEGGNH